MSGLSLSQQAYTHIKRRIVDREFTENPYTSENALVAELGMSRTPIREALRQLQSEGFVQIMPRKGIVIQLPSVKETHDYYDLRLAIELHALRSLSGHLTDAHFATMDANIAEQDKAYATGDYDTWLKLDEKFHRLFLEVLDNKIFLDLADTIRQRVYFKPTEFLRRDYYGISLRDHHEFAAQLKAGDFAAAEKTLHRHIMRGRAAYGR